MQSDLERTELSRLGCSEDRGGAARWVRGVDSDDWALHQGLYPPSAPMASRFVSSVRFTSEVTSRAVSHRVGLSRPAGNAEISALLVEFRANALIEPRIGFAMDALFL